MFNFSDVMPLEMRAAAKMLSRSERVLNFTMMFFGCGLFGLAWGTRCTDIMSFGAIFCFSATPTSCTIATRFSLRFSGRLPISRLHWRACCSMISILDSSVTMVFSFCSRYSTFLLREVMLLKASSVFLLISSYFSLKKVTALLTSLNSESMAVIFSSCLANHFSKRSFMLAWKLAMSFCKESSPKRTNWFLKVT
ncbi:hypothetical protein JYU34_007487 [Plutella xylostella]|uniref:Uncharacterized protein n=1 Tax=Plutella xylostella TaxID=51655 RepID=A0ABQ7QQL0_PLUXY|nr:hypothetical protein JYU34_007487 [Plutella xylostella]